MDTPYRRILIVRLSSLGDTVLTMPLLFALRSRAPTAYIGWVIGEAASPLLEALPQLDCVHVWKNRDREPFGLLRLARELRSKHYEVSIDPQGLAKSAILPILAGIRERVGRRCVRS